MEEQTFKIELIANANYRMDESLRMIQLSCDQLSETDIWKKPNGALNSVGNLILHLCGNITQYAISSLGGAIDNRQRDLEFQSSETHKKAALLAKLGNTIATAKDVLARLESEEFLRKREVQGFYLSGVGIIIHFVEHLSYHTGQIAFWTKILKEKDLGFYDDRDLNIKNDD